MDKKELLQELDNLKTQLETAVNQKAKEEIAAQIKALEGKIPDTKGLETSVTEVKTAVGDIKTTVEELKQASITRDEADKKNQEAMDAMIAFQKDFRSSLGGQVPKGDLKEAMLQAFTEKKDNMKNYKSTRAAQNFDIKAVGNIGSSNFTVSGTQGFINSAGISGIGRKPYETTHIRNLLTQLPIADRYDSLYVIRDAGGEGGPTSVAAGATKPQSDRDWVKLVVPVTKIGHHYRIPEEWLEDLEWLAGEISAVGVEELLAVEDEKILNNTTSGEFQGLTTTVNSTAFASPASLALAIDNANNYDVLVAAWTQLRNLKVSNVTGVLVNPSDYARMILTKATTGEYLFGPPGMVPNIMGVPLIPHTAIASDKFLIGDYNQVVLGQRAGISVRFYDQDQDNAIKNMVTVVIEERLAVVARRADKLIYGDFSDARAALETA